MGYSRKNILGFAFVGLVLSLWPAFFLLKGVRLNSNVQAGDLDTDILLAMQNAGAFHDEDGQLQQDFYRSRAGQELRYFHNQLLQGRIDSAEYAGRTNTAKVEFVKATEHLRLLVGLRQYKAAFASDTSESVVP